MLLGGVLWGGWQNHFWLRTSPLGYSFCQFSPCFWARLLRNQGLCCKACPHYGVLKHSAVNINININKSTNKCWRGCREKGTLVHCRWEGRLVRPLWKTVWNFLRKLKMEPPFDPAILLLGLYPKNPAADSLEGETFLGIGLGGSWHNGNNFPCNFGFLFKN